MKDSQEILSSILKTTQMGQVGVRCVLNSAVQTQLRQALKSQLAEYTAIECEAHALASSRGWELEELEPAAKTMAAMVTRPQLMFGSVDSKIAAMMIQGNTRGMIKSIKNQHHYHKRDAQVTLLAQKLLDCETANIKQMQGFL